MRFRFTQEGARPYLHGRVLLDDYDASSAVSGFTVKSSVHDITTVTLDVVVLHGADLDMDADVLIPGPVAALLVAHGWTAPEGSEVRGGAMRLMRTVDPEPTLLDELDITEYGNTPKPIKVGKPSCNCQGEWHGGEHTSDCPTVRI